MAPCYRQCHYNAGYNSGPANPLPLEDNDKVKKKIDKNRKKLEEIASNQTTVAFSLLLRLLPSMELTADKYAKTRLLTSRYTDHSQLLKRILLKFNSSSIALLTMCIS